MAAVTITNRADNVLGNQRIITGIITIAADGDTFDSGLHIIQSVTATSSTNNGIGATVSAGTIAFQTGGAEANVYMQVVGV